jgi:tellurite resistance protein TerC
MELFGWHPSTEFYALIGFHLFILLMLALDLGLFQRRAHAVTVTEAAVWSAVWVVLALAFAAGIWYFWDRWHGLPPGEEGPDKALKFVAGYLVEKSLSVDNLFVFLVIFRYFGVPAHLQHRVLFWGILGALIMRASLILVGAALLQAFHFMEYVFGAFLVYTGYKLMKSVEEDIDPGKNPLLRLAQRYLPLFNSYETTKFWVKRGGKWFVTPLSLVLLVVESTDVMFALDSIPAIFAITSDTFIVYTSNIFAILGLRSLYFLLAGFLGKFRFLNYGLAAVLAFVGLKMLLADVLDRFDREVPITLSLGVIAAILGVAVVASLLSPAKEIVEHPPEEVVEDPSQLPAEAGGDGSPRPPQGAAS